MSTVGETLSRWLRGSDAPTVHAPLLDAARIAHLLALGRNRTLLAAAPASRFVAGDIAAKRPGSGMEFDDNRPYEVGDDARYINWRLSARAGTPYVKVFRQEHRPCAFVIVDRRAAMRFGTVQRLKIQQAAAAAILFVSAAVHRGAPVGGLMIEAGPQWLEPRHGDTATRSLVQAAARSAPPLERPSEPTLDEMLKHAAARLHPGCELLLISDFNDLDPAGAATLVRLSRDHRVRALHISDPAEFALPDAGVLELAAASGGDAVAVDSHRAGLRAAFAALVNARLQTQLNHLSGAGIRYRTLSTADELSPQALRTG